MKLQDLLDNVSRRFKIPFCYQLCFDGNPLGVKRHHIPPEKLHSIQERIMDHIMELYSPCIIGRPKTVLSEGWFEWKTV